METRFAHRTFSRRLLMSSLPTKTVFLERLYLTLEIQAICGRKFLRFRRGPGPPVPPVGCATVKENNQTRLINPVGRPQTLVDRVDQLACRPIQGGPENLTHFVRLITSSNIDQFSKTFHCQNQLQS